MIEFLLLFSLGFLAAALIGLLVAPVIYRRIVTLTERRMRASVPLSRAEVKAEKDFARAAFAAENARLAVDLRGEMDLRAIETAKTVRLEGIVAENREALFSLQQKIVLNDEEAGNLRSIIRGQETELSTIRAELSSANREITEKTTEIRSLNDRIHRLDGRLEEMKIDLATGGTEIENFKAQIQALRDERAMLREELRGRTAAARESEIKLQRAQSQASELDERLARTISNLTDKEELLENRTQTIADLKERQKELAAEVRDATKAIKLAESQRKRLESDLTKLKTGERVNQRQTTKPGRSMSAARDKTAGSKKKPAGDVPPPREIDELIGHLRIRQTALSERVKKANKPDDDPALRDEIAEIAALMVELTARREGDRSAIHVLLSGSPSGDGNGPISLADRARSKLEAAGVS